MEVLPPGFVGEAECTGGSCESREKSAIMDVSLCGESLGEISKGFIIMVP